MGCGASHAVGPAPEGVTASEKSTSSECQPALGKAEGMVPSKETASSTLHPSAPPAPVRRASSGIPDKAALRRKSIHSIMAAGLLEAEAASLAGVMTIAELVHTNARLARLGRIAALEASTAGEPVVVAPSGLTQPEAEALVAALDENELARTVLRTGLSMKDVATDDSEALRSRALVALQHPLPALPAAVAAQPDAELLARQKSLKQLAVVVLADTPLPSTAAPTASDSDDGTSPGAREVVPAEEAALAEAVLQKWAGESTPADDHWQDQLLALFNNDRRQAHLPPLLAHGSRHGSAVAATRQASGESLGQATAPVSAPSADEVGPLPKLAHRQPSVWRIWCEDDEHPDAATDPPSHALADSAEATRRASDGATGEGVAADEAAANEGNEVAAAPSEAPGEGGVSEYDAFWNALPRDAQEVRTGRLATCSHRSTRIWRGGDAACGAHTPSITSMRTVRAPRSLRATAMVRP